MDINRIYLPSILMKKKDICDLSADEEGNLFTPEKIRENSFNHYKKIFENCGYKTKKNEKNFNLVMFNNNQEINFDLSTLVIKKTYEKTDYKKLFTALKVAGVAKLTSIDLEDKEDVQGLISKYNAQVKEENKSKKIIKYCGNYKGMGDAEYIDVAAVGKIESLYSLSDTIKREIKDIRIEEAKEDKINKEEKAFEEYLSVLDKRDFHHNEANYEKALEAYKNNIPASKLPMNQFEKENKIVAKNLIKISVRGNTNIDRIWNNLHNNEVAHIVDKKVLEDAVAKIRQKRISSIKTKKEKYELERKEQVKQRENKKKELVQRREEYRNQSVTLFNSFKSPDLCIVSNDNVKPTDYDMTITHVDEKLLSPDNKVSDIQQKIFSKDDAVKTISSQWKSYVKDEGEKHNHIAEDASNKSVSIKIYNSSKDKFFHKRGLSKAGFTEIIDHGNKINIIGEKRKNLYDDVVKMAIERGFKTINFGKIKKEEDKVKLLQSCARFGIAPKGSLPRNPKAWSDAMKLASENEHNFEEFCKFRSQKTHQNKTVTLNKSIQNNNDSMVG